MKTVLGSASVLAVCASAAFAGGIDRSGQSIGIIFERGSYAELTFGAVSPNVSGIGSGFSPTPGADSGDMAASYIQFSAAYKQPLSNNLDFAVILDQPFGANVDYPAGSGYFAGGATADLNTMAVTGILKYTTESNISVYGGLRYQTFNAEAVVPFVGGYTGSTNTDSGLGYLVGVAYERPEIALRVALTYNSKIDHTFEVTEFGAPSADMDVTTPQSVNLDFQTGVAEGTLVFGSIRWVEWSEFDITPAAYFTATGGNSLVSYEDDRITYTIGVGRKFTENLSGALTLGYEAQAGGFSSNLGPTDGFFSIGLGGAYTMDNVKISGGIRYVMIGDAETTLGGGVAASEFEDNHALGIGVKIGYSF